MRASACRTYGHIARFFSVHTPPPVAEVFTLPQSVSNHTAPAQNCLLLNLLSFLVHFSSSFALLLSYHTSSYFLPSFPFLPFVLNTSRPFWARHWILYWTVCHCHYPHPFFLPSFLASLSLPPSLVLPPFFLQWPHTHKHTYINIYVHAQPCICTAWLLHRYHDGCHHRYIIPVVTISATVSAIPTTTTYHDIA